MSERRKGLATATVGAAGVGGAAALRHEALVRSYNERGSKPIPRKGVAGTGMMSELRMVKHPRGRKVWLAGAGLGAVSLPALATGSHKTIYGKRDKDSFWREGVTGAKDAVVDRTHTATQKTPPKLVAGNYAAGVGIGSVAGGLTHLGLRKVKLPQHGKSAVAAITAGVVGTAALPLQSKATSRATKGKYVVTPTGVRRAKQAPKRPSSQASVYDARAMSGQQFRAQTVAKARRWPGPKPFKPIQTGLFEGTPSEDMVRLEAARAKNAKKREAARRMRAEAFGHAQARVESQPKTGRSDARAAADELRRRSSGEIEKMSPKTLVRKPASLANVAGAHAGAHWTTNLLRVADKVDVPDRRVIPKTRKGVLVHTGRTKAANAVRQAAFDVGSINDKDAMMRNTAHGHPLFGKSLSDPGATMSRGERRARVTASGIPLPIVGDTMQAAAAARYAPKGRKAKAAATNFAGGQTGQAVGMAAGTGLALGAARLSPTFDRKAKHASDTVDRVTTAGRAKVGLKPAGPSLLTRGVEHPRTPAKVKDVARSITGSPVGRAIARNPKTAAVGALVGGTIGGMAGQQTAYGHVMTRDDAVRARRAKANAYHSMAKAAGPAVAMTHDEQKKLRRKKNQSAALSVVGGTTGTSALAATLGHRALSDKRVKPHLAHTSWAKPLRGRLKAVQVPLLTAGAGVGGYNAFNYAAIQHREARSVGKALRVPGVRLRAPGMRRGYLRQVRVPSTGALRVSTVRGGLG